MITFNYYLYILMAFLSGWVQKREVGPIDYGGNQLNRG